MDELSKEIQDIKNICLTIDSSNKQDVDLNLLGIIDICNKIK